MGLKELNPKGSPIGPEAFGRANHHLRIHERGFRANPTYKDSSLEKLIQEEKANPVRERTSV
jgi:hypothetical protein